jgi:hypothetical protein
VTGIPQDFKPTNSASLNAMNMLKLYLFETIRQLPPSILSVPTHRQVFNFITKMAFAEADGSICGTTTSMLDSITRDEEVSNLLDEIQWQDYKFRLDDQVQISNFQILTNLVCFTTYSLGPRRNCFSARILS